MVFLWSCSCGGVFCGAGGSCGGVFSGGVV